MSRTAGQTLVNHGALVQPSTPSTVAVPQKQALVSRASEVARKQSAYLRGLSTVGTITAGCKAAKCDPRTVYQWRETDETFLLREREARESLNDMLESEAIRRGVKGTMAPVYQAGKLVGYKREYSDALLTLVLRANRPEKYRDRVDVGLSQVIKTIAGVDPADVL
jgi:hypothetical protein